MGFNVGNVLAILLKRYSLGDAAIATQSEKKLANLIISQFECCLKDEDNDEEIIYVDNDCKYNLRETSIKGVKRKSIGLVGSNNAASPSSKNSKISNKEINSQVLISNEVIVYTDGACSKNGNKSAKAGYGVFWGDNHSDNVSRPLEGNLQTNNRAEYMAVVCALQQSLSRGYSSVLVRTDSNLLIQSMTQWIKSWKRNGWKKRDNTPVLNVDLVKQLDYLMTKIKVRFEHVSAHVGIHGNEMADKLAREGAQK